MSLKCWKGAGGIVLMMLGMFHAQGDELDDAVTQEMQSHGVPGVSVAIVYNGQVISTRAYGNTGAGGAVTPETLFQAGSVSKVFTAVGALLLVERGKLSLDEDVNLQLKDWKVPENEFTGTEKVTVRRILNHTAGLNVHGFSGYARDQHLPFLTAILNGDGLANNRPIQVESVPGSKWAYSGGGYTVLQKLMVDVTGEPFPKWMDENVLQPLGMNHSTFRQPLPEEWRSLAAAGHEPGGREVPGQWHVFPEMAAAGLWTRPSDLALLMGALQKAKQGQTGGIISPEMARLMTTPGMHNDALGLFVTGPEKETFLHDGRNEGFDTLFSTRVLNGVVVMININDNSGVEKWIARAVWKDGE